MQINLEKIKVKELVKGYINNEEEGVYAFNQKLNIRPKYQREFIYPDKLRDAVIHTINHGYPLNVMYWVKNSDGNFEVLDGQQRSISICEYVVGNFSVDHRFFHNLQKDEKEKILDYELMIYICEGNDSEKLSWFKIINIAGMKLTDQEMRNAIYSGSWLTDAKKYFSKTGCPAQDIAGKYMKGKAIRQEYLETVLRWVSKDNIESFMAKNQHSENSNEIRKYFNEVIDWTKSIFQNYRKEMKGVDFGFLYNQFKKNKIDPKKLEEKISKLMQDEEVTNRAGIYLYVMNGEEKYLNLRSFSDKQKGIAYERQKGICAITKKKYSIEEMDADHIVPWSKGGKTDQENCQVVHKKANKEKSDKT